MGRKKKCNSPVNDPSGSSIPEPQQPQVNYGHIDIEKTPKWRTFEIEKDGKNGKVYTLIYLGVDPQNNLLRFQEDYGAFIHYSLADWHDRIAPYCIGYTDMPKEDRPAESSVAESLDLSAKPPAEAWQPAKDELAAAYSNLRDAEIAYAQAREEAKKCHEALTDAFGRLRQAAGRLLGDLGPLPLFDKTDGPDPGTGTARAVASQPPRPFDQDAWREIPLMELGIQDRYINALAEHDPPVTTMGELADWQAQKGDFWAADVRGLGGLAGKGREQIEAALEAFWANRANRARRKTPDKAEAAMPGAEMAVPGDDS